MIKEADPWTLVIQDLQDREPSHIKNEKLIKALKRQLVEERQKKDREIALLQQEIISIWQQ